MLMIASMRKPASPRRDGLAIRPYFRQVVDASHVRRGKPDPEIYLLAAERLGMPAGSDSRSVQLRQDFHPSGIDGLLRLRDLRIRVRPVAGRRVVTQRTVRPVTAREITNR